MNAHPFHRWRFLAFGAALVLAATACSRREEPPPPPPAPPAPQPAAANPPRVANPPPASPSAPAPVAPPPGANLDKVAQDAAAFGDMVDSLRQFAGEDVKFNAATLDLDSFIQGKSNPDLFKFAQQAGDKSPFAAMQVLEHLWRQDLDLELRLEIASLLGDLSSQFGYEKDRAVTRECVDWLAATCADPTHAAAMSAPERDELICTLHRLATNLDGHSFAAEKKIADAIRKSAQSDLELAYADEFDAFALMREGKAENVPAARAYLESMRARGVYGTLFALKMRVDYWLAFDEAAFAEEIRKSAEFLRKNETNGELQRQWRETIPPEKLFEEMRLRAAEAKRLATTNPL